MISLLFVTAIDWMDGGGSISWVAQKFAFQSLPSVKPARGFIDRVEVYVAFSRMRRAGRGVLRCDRIGDAIFSLSP
jgi:hypothetical protein